MDTILVLHELVEGEVKSNLSSNDHRRDLEQTKAGSISTKVSGTASLASFSSHLVNQLKETILSLQIAMLTDVVERHLEGVWVLRLLFAPGWQNPAGEIGATIV